MLMDAFSLAVSVKHRPVGICPSVRPSVCPTLTLWPNTTGAHQRYCSVMDRLTPLLRGTGCALS